MDKMTEHVNFNVAPETDIEKLMEALRTRINILNTSIFLLEDNLNNADLKTHEYIKKINMELERIRQLITHVPQLKMNVK